MFGAASDAGLVGAAKDRGGRITSWQVTAALTPAKFRSGEVSKFGSAGSRVTDYRAEDLFMKRQRRMRSAIDFIKSGGTLFPIPAPRWLPTSLNAYLGTYRFPPANKTVTL